MKKLVLLMAFLLIVVGAAFTWWSYGSGPVDKADTSEKIFVIQKGATIREIGSALKSENLIKDPVRFFLTVRLQGKDRSIQAGSYRLSPSMNLSEIIESLEHGTLDIWVTIPEGLRSEEIAEILQESFDQYDETWAERLKLYEGYLFPETYLVPNTADIDTIIAILTSTFNEKITEVGLSPDDPELERIIIIASLIEREALFDDDQHLISSVINNRLDIDMPLQIDATVQYALGYSDEEGKWWRRNLTIEDLKTASPYNTYESIGLPPGPISNPGILAIESAMNPDNSDYLFYLHDSEGHAHFAEDLDGHNENIANYLN